MPGQRILWMEMMKFRPVRMEENPEMKMPAAMAKTCEFEYFVLRGV